MLDPTKKPDPSKNIEYDSPEVNLAAVRPGDGVGTPSVFACPSCSGVLWEMQDGRLLRFRCRIGHAFTARTLLEEFQPRVEDPLWAAFRGLHELASFQERLMELADAEEAETLRQSADKKRSLAARIKEVIEHIAD